MRPALFAVLSLVVGLATASGQALPTDEAGAIAYLTGRGVEIVKDADGHATRLMSQGKTPLSAAEYALIGRLTHLEQVGLNAAPLTDGEWGFLRSLPRLKRLSIWHGHHFAGLGQFSGLPVEQLTIGGCMGLRDLHKEDPAAFRDAILTLKDLPNVTRLSVYHSPLLPGDEHVAHVVANCPKLESLMIDFAAPRGMATTVTPAGLAALQKLPLTSLSLENVTTFTPAHFEALAAIGTLDELLIDARRSPVPPEDLAAFTTARPDVAVAVAQPGDAGPPRVAR